MLADFYIPRLWNNMNITVQKNHLGDLMLYRSLDPSKNGVNIIYTYILISDTYWIRPFNKMKFNKNILTYKIPVILNSPFFLNLQEFWHHIFQKWGKILIFLFFSYFCFSSIETSQGGDLFIIFLFCNHFVKYNQTLTVC